MPPTQPLDAAAVGPGNYIEQDGTKFVVSDTFIGSSGTLLLLSEVNDEGEPQGPTRVVQQSAAMHQYDAAEVEFPDPADPANQQAGNEDRIAALEAHIARLSQPGPGGADQTQSGGEQGGGDEPIPGADRQTGRTEPSGPLADTSGGAGEPQESGEPSPSRDVPGQTPADTPPAAPSQQEPTGPANPTQGV